MSSIEILDRANRAIGRQLSNPHGVGGRLVGAAMRYANRWPTRALIDAMDIRPEHRVLDVGCGDGSALAAVPHARLRCGVDRSETMLAVAKARLRRSIHEGRVKLTFGDMMELPVETGGYDRIVASNILYFCEDVPAFIEECRKVAAPGALLGIYVTAAASMAKWRFASRLTHRHFTRAELDKELDRAGAAPEKRTLIELPLPGDVEGLIALVQLS